MKTFAAIALSLFALSANAYQPPMSEPHFPTMTDTQRDQMIRETHRAATCNPRLGYCG